MIYDTGCIPAAEAWIDNNIIPVAGTAVGIAVVEVSVHTTLMSDQSIVAVCCSSKPVWSLLLSCTNDTSNFPAGIGLLGRPVHEGFFIKLHLSSF